MWLLIPISLVVFGLAARDRSTEPDVEPNEDLYLMYARAIAFLLAVISAVLLISGGHSMNLIPDLQTMMMRFSGSR